MLFSQGKKDRKEKEATRINDKAVRDHIASPVSTSCPTLNQ